MKIKNIWNHHPVLVNDYLGFLRVAFDYDCLLNIP